MQRNARVVPAFLRVASNVGECITIQVSCVHCIRGAVSISRKLVRSTSLLPKFFMAHEPFTTEWVIWGIDILDRAIKQGLGDKSTDIRRLF